MQDTKVAADETELSTLSHRIRSRDVFVRVPGR
jgi:hypothetical protein